MIREFIQFFPHAPATHLLDMLLEASQTLRPVVQTGRQKQERTPKPFLLPAHEGRVNLRATRHFLGSLQVKIESDCVTEPCRY
jgi:hypothetical protein